MPFSDARCGPLHRGCRTRHRCRAKGINARAYFTHLSEQCRGQPPALTSKPFCPATPAAADRRRGFA